MKYEFASEIRLNLFLELTESASSKTKAILGAHCYSYVALRSSSKSPGNTMEKLMYTYTFPKMWHIGILGELCSNRQTDNI